MKDILPNQKNLNDLIYKEGLKAPKFLDIKQPEHGGAFVIIQNIYETIALLASQQFLSDTVIELAYWEIDGELKRIKNTDLQFKVHDYILKKLNRYFALSIELECYEGATNLRKFLHP